MKSTLMLVCGVFLFGLGMAEDNFDYDYDYNATDGRPLHFGKHQRPSLPRPQHPEHDKWMGKVQAPIFLPPSPAAPGSAGRKQRRGNATTAATLSLGRSGPAAHIWVALRQPTSLLHR
ncbi:hypothetical protein AALO_G00056070 [Alosa alosa]|uniref:Uncharacterized protein n=1 Tax=Alosa alosa TaxID=278164 RepID=A0AAV6HA49_9TELE|nr:hypothetical protein AALO_G00056070 [Alosa alosa]